MIPLFKVRMSPTADAAVSKVLQSGFIGQGPVVEQFEDALQVALKTKVRPVTVNSCTSAIDLALELCGVDSDAEVIATPQTCFASNVHIIHRKARIRWADIDPVTGLIDPESVKRLISKNTKAIVAVNWAGKFCDYKELKSYGVPVIEDAAHTWDSFLEPSVERGDYICYSFQAIKYLTTADGGALICPPEKENEARILRWYGLDRTKNESFRCTQNITRVGFKYHMNDVNASIGIENIPYAHASVLLGRENSKYYINHINNPLVYFPEWDEKCSYWLFSMHVSDNKQKFIDYLHANGIAASPVHYRNDKYDTTIHYGEGVLPGVDKFDKTQVCIPNGWWLSPKDIEHIINVINRYE
jgi:dTDP-4-amino-4,6-dideoxygalactose transaminase